MTSDSGAPDSTTAPAVDAADAGDAGDAESAPPADAAVNDGSMGDTDGRALEDAGADAADAAPPACVPAQCPSGACEADGGACTAPCSAASACGTGLTCCSGRCIDVAHDPRNCGACGNACTTAELCTGTACTSATLDNLCVNARTLLVTDGIADDDTAGAVMAAGLRACAPPIIVAPAPAGALEPTTSRPVAGVGATCLAAGGPFGQPMIGYMDQTDMPVVPWGDTTSTAFITRGSVDVVRVPVTSITTGHDYFLVALATEPQSGTVVLSSYGFFANGTRAAAWYFANVVVPTRAARAKRWYVYEWTDADGALEPDANDAFVEVASGL